MPADRGSRGNYCYAVKGNQPTRLPDLTAIGDAEPPAPPPAVPTDPHGGRVEPRRLWAADLLVGYSDWPHLGQVCRLERIVRNQNSINQNSTRRELADAVTSWPPQEASSRKAPHLMAGTLGHREPSALGMRRYL